MLLERNFKFHLVLIEPLIPPNTGNAGRLAVATESTLHLVGQLGFDIDDKQVRRAGLDYWKHVDLIQHKTFEDFLNWFEKNEPGAPFYLFDNLPHFEPNFFAKKIPSRAALVFGKETSGIPKEILEKYKSQIATIPMFSDKIRSLNLSNTISIALYEAIRQQLN